MVSPHPVTAGTGAPVGMGVIQRASPGGFSWAAVHGKRQELNPAPSMQGSDVAQNYQTGI